MYRVLFKNIYFAIRYKRFDLKFLQHCQILLKTLYLNKKEDDIFYLIQFLLLLNHRDNLMLLETAHYVKNLIKRNISNHEAIQKLEYYTKLLNSLKFEDVVMLKACHITYFYYM